MSCFGQTKSVINLLVDLYGDRLRRFLWSRFKTRLSLEDIDEVISDVVYIAIKTISSFNPNASDKNGFRNWLFTIGNRKCLDRLRSLKPLPDTVSLNEELDERARNYHPNADSDPVSDGLMGQAKIGAVQRVLDEMAPEKRDILFLNIVQDIPPEEIARFQNKLAGTIRTQLTRARDDFYSRILKQPEFADWAQQMPPDRPSKR